MKPLKKSISLSLDPDVVEKLKKLADDDDRSLSQFINIILRQWISEGNQSVFPDSPKK